MGALDRTKFDDGLEYEPTVIKANGGYEGASRFSRELASWAPVVLPADNEINPEKQLLDARSRDIVRNDGLVSGAVSIHRDSIVGGFYALNCRPDWRALGLDETWAEEFQNEVEPKFRLWAESINNWPDASRVNTLTGLVRLAIGVYVYSGEVLATAEWLRQAYRPFSTAIQMVDLDRLSNPMGASDTSTVRRGVERDRYGAAQAYHIRMAHPNERYGDNAADRWLWKRVATRKPWGRLQVIHIVEQMRPDQTRGVAEMVAGLKTMKMTSRFKDIVLQNAVLNASYAATIESELPPEAAYGQIGGGTGDWANEYLMQIAEYSGSSRNLHIDGIKIPHLYPGTKLKLLNAGQPGGIGTGFEESLLRHTAAALGLSYEQFSRDYTKTNYSSARASMNETWKYMQSRKKMVADRFATNIFALWLEEAISSGEITSLPSTMPNFWEGMNKDAYTRCDWIGSSRGQIDELKETEAAIARIESGLSTYEKEAARLGEDFRELFAQRAREKKMMMDLDILPISQTPPPPPAAPGSGESSDTAKLAAGLMSLAQAMLAREPQSITVNSPVNVAAPPAAPISVEAPVINMPPQSVTVNMPRPGAVSQEMSYDAEGNLLTMKTTHED
jgi:lambda family phage portal protein